jgi:hypothetical protein
MHGAGGAATARDASSAVGRKIRIAIGIAILLALGATLITLDRYGKSRRRLAPRRQRVELARPEEAFEVWKNAGARGRTLILFGAFPHLWKPSTGSVGNRQGVVERAALANIVRRVYFLAPDDRWDELFGQELPGFYRKVPGVERGLYMHYSLGLPVIATTPSSLPALAEPALVYVDKGRFEPAFAEEVLSRKGIDSDVIIVSTGL